MDPIEPNWNKLRTLCLDSASQFRPIPPTKFNSKEGSPFYKEMIEVYDIANELDKDQKAIAAFWDCNPYVVAHMGHLMQPIKKITPGGHWMEIAKIAAIQDNANMEKLLTGYLYTSVALFDAFISCWDEKYRSSYIRPETIINYTIDKNWRPFLQTPPFPEYTSGHSVISTAAAIALTHVYGENFKFLDTSEEKYGLPAREFSSFKEASREAAISRIYGGIHFRPAVENGVGQGENVGNLVVSSLSAVEDE